MCVFFINKMCHQFMLSLLQTVTIDNVEEYIDLVTDFCLNVGIRRQMEALKGLCKLFYSIHFSADEKNKLVLFSLSCVNFFGVTC